jgi:hypothetical protein
MARGGVVSARAGQSLHFLRQTGLLGSKVGLDIGKGFVRVVDLLFDARQSLWLVCGGGPSNLKVAHALLGLCRPPNDRACLYGDGEEQTDRDALLQVPLV